MKDSGGAVSCNEINFAIVVDNEAGTADSRGSFVGESWGHRVAREFFPVFAIGGADEYELSVNRISKRQTFLIGDAGKRVKREVPARARKLEPPAIASVARFVDARQFSRADGHNVGDFFAERLNSAEIEFLIAIDNEAGIVLAPIVRSKQAAARTGRPDDRGSVALRIAGVSGGNGVKI